jgi:hypothetical protein
MKYNLSDIQLGAGGFGMVLVALLRYDGTVLTNKKGDEREGSGKVHYKV